jgi:hypothetical protein
VVGATIAWSSGRAAPLASIAAATASMSSTIRKNA